MQLREIHIDGFGIFRDVHILGLSSGINVIYGPNEFGKSTLLAFIRRILFGFPSKNSKANPYPTSTGSAYGGKLKCELSTGEIVTIARKPGAHGGTVNINTDSSEFTGEDGLRKLFKGNISSTFYENVYAIGLEELETITSLENERVKEHIYSASLGLEKTTLADVKRKFTNKADVIFTKQGKIQKIPVLYKEIHELKENIANMQQELSNYDAVVQQRDILINEVTELDRRIKEQQELIRSIEYKQKLFPTYIELKNNENKLSSLPEVSAFAPDSLAGMEQLKKNIEYLQKQIEEEKESLAKLELESQQLVFNEQILSLEPTIIDLQKKSESYKSAIKDISPVISDRNSLKSDIDKEINKIGAGWTEDTIRNLDLTYLQRETINSYKCKLSDIRAKVEGSRTKLELHREQKALEMSRSLPGIAINKYIAYCIATIGLIGTVIGLLLSNPLASILSVIFLIIGIITSISVTRRNRALLPDELEKKYHKDLDDALQEEKRLNQEWQEFLDTINFPAGLSPDGALQLSSAVEIVQSKIKSLDQYNERINKMQRTIELTTELHRKFTAGLDKSLLSDNIEANIEILSQQLNAANNIKQQKESLERQIKQKRAKIDNLNMKKQETEADLKKYIIAHQALDEQDFKSKCQIYEEREKLKKTIIELQKSIQNVVGIRERYHSFIQAIEGTNKEEIESQLDNLRAALKTLEEERDQKKEQIGGLKTKIEQLSSNEDLLAKQEELEIKKQQLNEYSREWAKAQIAVFILDKAASKYENTRQPAQIEAASDILASITNGVYPKIIKPIDSDEFKIRNKGEVTKSVEQMSRGTVEQLFLALRLGLIKVYEEQAEPMPIVMDDILVNFDDTRGPLAIEALSKFAKNRQIIVLTCHQNTLDIYKRFGAREIIFS